MLKLSLSRGDIDRPKRLREALADGKLARAVYGSVPTVCVRFVELVAHPLRTVAGAYRHFNLELSTSAAVRIACAAREQPKGGYGFHSYRLEDFGLHGVIEREKFTPYIQFFDVETSKPA